METTFVYTVSIQWEDTYTGDSCPPFIVADFKFYQDAKDYAKIS